MVEVVVLFWKLQCELTEWDVVWGDQRSNFKYEASDPGK